MMIRKLAIPAALCAAMTLAIGPFGCGGGTSTSTSSQERFFNALVGGPSNGIDFVQRNAVVNTTAVNYGAIIPNGATVLGNGVSGTSPRYYSVASGGIAAINANQVPTSVYQAGADTGTQIANDSFLLDPNSPIGSTNGTYTIVVSGIAGQTTGATAPKVLRFGDTLFSASGTGNAYVRLINLSPDQFAITLNNTTGGGSATVVSNIGYNAASAYTPIAIQGGVSQSLTLGLTGNSAAISLPASAATVTLAAGHAYTLFYIGQVSQTAPYSPNLVTVQDQ